MIKIYGLKNCDTCRAALKAMTGAGQAARLVDMRTNPLDGALLQRALAQFGDALINRRSTTWRGLDDATRAKDALRLLQTHPTLMKRPLIDYDGALTLGWDNAKATQKNTKE